MASRTFFFVSKLYLASGNNIHAKRNCNKICKFIKFTLLFKATWFLCFEKKVEFISAYDILSSTSYILMAKII